MSLGVLQALARARLFAPVAGAAAEIRLLRRFDYLSTVSGGGYIGAFLCSLFVPGRRSNDPNETARVAADKAYQVLEYEPPGRLHFSDRWSHFRNLAVCITTTND